MDNTAGSLRRNILYFLKFFLLFLKYMFLKLFNPIPAGGGGQFDPPCSFFYITQKVLD